MSNPKTTGSARTYEDAVVEVAHRIAHYLPTQGPINVFVHHNTLHALQHLPFHEALAAAANMHDAEPYWSEARFRDEVRIGRITPEDVADVLLQEHQRGSVRLSTLACGVTNHDLLQSLLIPGARAHDTGSIAYLLDEERIQERDSDGHVSPKLAALYDVVAERCAREAARLRRDESLPALDYMGRMAREHFASVARLAACYLDQGSAMWAMPNRDLGFFRASVELIAATSPDITGFGWDVRMSARHVLSSERSPSEFAAAELKRRGVAESALEAFLMEALKPFRGFAGMFAMLEAQPELLEHVRVRAALMDFLAVVLLFTAPPSGERAIVSTGAPTQVDLSLPERRAATFMVFEAARLLGFDASRVAEMPEHAFAELVDSVMKYDSFVRRRYLFLAFEAAHTRGMVGALLAHDSERRPGEPSATSVSAQVFCCLDEREESFRRHLEERDPTIQTLGVAGFYGMAMRFQGLEDHQSYSLCPVVVTPTHIVIEQPATERDPAQAYITRWKRNAKLLSLRSRLSRTLWAGALSLLISAIDLAIRTVGRVLFAARNASATVRPATSFTAPRQDGAPRHESARGESWLHGFSVDEAAQRIDNLLRPAGLGSGFAPLVVFLGHGATCQNNPHESAYNCGACGGRRGEPNARLIADLANREDVRSALRARGLDIPETTWFLGGYHDTTSDTVRFADIDRAPSSFSAQLSGFEKTLQAALADNALERTRRFANKARPTNPASALAEVTARSQHIGEARPEYGHASNAVAFFGRRERTRGLFLDRRWFLISYDPTIDPDGNSLGGLLGAAGPVCAGISLEYYFSSVDNEAYGCGTKVPHNLTGLIGVMNGAMSDLRTGLPLQTVEIHEPMRLLLIVEATPEQLNNAMRASQEVTELFEKEWVRPIALLPDGSGALAYENGRYVPVTFETVLPETPSSAMYANTTAHLPVARLRPRAQNHARIGGKAA